MFFVSNEKFYFTIHLIVFTEILVTYTYKENLKLYILYVKKIVPGTETTRGTNLKLKNSLTLGLFREKVFILYPILL